MKLFYKIMTKNLFLICIFCFLVTLLLRLYLADFISPIREDAYIYLLKGLEIIKGNLIPVHTHDIGLSIIIAPILYFFGYESIFSNMNLAIVFNIILGSLSIFPFYFIVKNLGNKTFIFISILFFSFSYPLIKSSITFIAEPVFTLLLLYSILFTIKSFDNKKYIILAYIFASLSLIVKMTGILIFFVVSVSFIFLFKKNIYKNYKYILLGILLFCIISSSILITRYNTYGSPFTHGENDKFLVDTYSQVWSENIPVPTLSEYFNTHSILDIFDKFFVNGFLEILINLFHPMGGERYSYIVSPILLFFLIFGLISNISKKSFIPIYLTIFIYIFALSIVYSIFKTNRHLLPLVPLFIIFSASGITQLIEKIKNKHIYIYLICSAYILFTLIPSIHYRYNYNGTSMMPNWALWISQNIKGKLAIIEGGDYVMMNLYDTSVAGVGLFDLYANESGLSISRPGEFENLNDALRYFNLIGITHIAIDNLNIKKRPYLSEILIDNNNYFEEVYSNYKTNEKWKIKVFKVNWNNLKL